MSVDLRSLAIERQPQTATGRRPVYVFSRYIVPGVILIGFLALVLWSARASLGARTPVTVMPVLATRSEVQQTGAPMFSAAGWIEPRPTPVQVAALAEGVVERLLVIEGQHVKAAQPIAQLVAADAELAVQSAQADLELRDAELSSAQVALTAAEQTLEQPVELEAAVADARALHAHARTSQAELPFQIEAAKARARLARQTLEGRQAAGAAVSGREMQRAQSDAAGAEAALKELVQRRESLTHEVRALDEKRAATEKQLELKIDLQRGLGEARANLRAAKARRDLARVAVRSAELRLDRMTVRAPIDGRVLTLVAQPGSRVMGQGGETSAVVTLYNPAMLQVRADVRLEDVPRVELGGKVQVETAALRQPVTGKVISITGLADIQKNTLQVKVALEQPPDVLRPEMLVQATFLAPDKPRLNKQSSRVRLFVPRAMVSSDQSGAHVWLVDQAEGVAHRRSIVLGQKAGGDLTEVVSGLRAGDKIIADRHAELREGIRIEITGEGKK